MSKLVMRLRGASSSAFLRGVAALMSGNALATIIPLLTAPLLGRLYAPADYGVLAQYMAPAALLAVFASLQFQHAIIAEQTDRGAGGAVWVVLVSTVAAVGLTILAVAVLWLPLLAESTVGGWFALLPLSVAVSGLTAAGSFLANRNRHYGWIAQLQVIQVLTSVGLSIVLGFMGWGANGLLLAYFLSQLVLGTAYLWLLATLGDTLNWPGIMQLRLIVRRHWKFPAFTLPSGLLNQTNMQMPVFALTLLGDTAMLGSFTRARQLVLLPVTVVGHSVAQVFRREASELYHKTGSCRELMLRTAGGLFAVSIGPCLLFMAFAPWLFAVYLGPAWREAGEIARILAPMLMLRAIAAPVTTILFFAGRQVLDLALTIVSTTLIAGGIFFGWAVVGTATSVIWAFALGYGGIYMMYFGVCFFVAKS
ncbi:colanic acid exporter [Falsiruegeria litorea R37]|uniref:Colanic acid exporter n=1 Tax=Falsiruegeria litorea R37 TaxID=1200284 RepID=A0A1Y5U1H1_9RHOB|nr:oligosaccharide flippase family protein [Falsiruegeria litorea]SLN74490.1 colanic acid exporter [Falsiruegeria litorea R37]